MHSCPRSVPQNVDHSQGQVERGSLLASSAPSSPQVELWALDASPKELAWDGLGSLPSGGPQSECLEAEGKGVHVSGVGVGGRKVGCPTARRPDMPVSATQEGSCEPQSPDAVLWENSWRTLCARAKFRVQFPVSGNPVGILTLALQGECALPPPHPPTPTLPHWVRRAPGDQGSHCFYLVSCYCGILRLLRAPPLERNYC